MKLVQKAKAMMLIKHVFFASLLLSTKCEENKRLPTAATDGVKVMYNPDFIEGLGDVQLVMFVLIHEIMHIILKHNIRRGLRDPMKWNIACDFAINWMLKKNGVMVWEHCCCDEKYDGMSAEQIYEEREQEAKKKKGGGGGGSGPPSKGKRGEGKPDNGDPGDQGGMGQDVIEPDVIDAATKAEIESAVAQKIANAANMARMQGKMSADFERLVDGALNPPLPWQALLREFMTSSAKNDESWNRRNRRFHEYYLPTRFSEAMGEIVVIGDTSGSMGDNVFAQIGEELNEIVEQVKPERVRVIWADDHECKLEEIFEPGDDIVLHPKGGGGTDMRKPLIHVEQFDPIVVVLITDGETPWPKSDPPYPLIVCCTTRANCPVGRVVRMEGVGS